MSIEKYNFCDQNILHAVEDGEFVELRTTVWGEGCVSLIKRDAIALAKHFKLTEEDLK